MQVKLDVRSALIMVVLYPIISVFAGILARILFGGPGEPQGSIRINDLIGIGMYGTIITSIILLLISVFVFKGSRNDIFFERKPFRLSPLYYLFPLVLVGVTLFALFNVDYSAYSIDVILLVILATLAIGFNEEVVTRGILLVGLRNSRVAEWLVFVITLAVFSLYHLVNLLSGGNLIVLLVTFTGGVIYYVSRRVFNNLFAPIALHALYDTGFFLLPGSSIAGESLPENVLDIQFGAFLIVLVASIVFLIFGRKLLRDETVGWA